jgi:hypothetical protein
MIFQLCQRFIRKKGVLYASIHKRLLNIHFIFLLWGDVFFLSVRKIQLVGLTIANPVLDTSNI